MPGFWELPELSQLPDVKPRRPLGKFKHGITFHVYCFEVVEAGEPDDLGICQWVRTDDLGQLPLSTVTKKAKRIAEKSQLPRAAKESVAATA